MQTAVQRLMSAVPQVQILHCKIGSIVVHFLFSFRPMIPAVRLMSRVSTHEDGGDGEGSAGLAASVA